MIVSRPPLTIVVLGLNAWTTSSHLITHSLKQSENLEIEIYGKKSRDACMRVHVFVCSCISVLVLMTRGSTRLESFINLQFVNKACLIGPPTDNNTKRPGTIVSVPILTNQIRISNLFFRMKLQMSGLSAATSQLFSEPIECLSNFTI